MYFVRTQDAVLPVHSFTYYYARALTQIYVETCAQVYVFAHLARASLLLKAGLEGTHLLVDALLLCCSDLFVQVVNPRP